MNDSYSEEELEALPQTTQIFDSSLLHVNLDQHELVQEGYTVTDRCHAISFSIPTGKTLVKQNGGYQLIDEL